jgi:hypothetical protein
MTASIPRLLSALNFFTTCILIIRAVIKPAESNEWIVNELNRILKEMVEAYVRITCPRVIF